VSTTGQIYRVLAVVLCALTFAPAAQAQTTTVVQRSGPFKIGPYATVKPSGPVAPPQATGAIVGTG